MKLNKIKIPALIFLLTFTVYLSNLSFDYKRNLETGQVRRLLTSNDLVPNTFLPYLILKYKTLDFSYIQNDLKKYFQGGTDNPYYFIRLNGKYISSYPILTGILAIPFYIIPIALNKIPTLIHHRDLLKVLVIGRIAASFYATLSVVLMYFILDKITKDKMWKYIYTAFYALGTLTWTISSRGLWQHTISQLLISIIVYIFLLRKEKPKLIPVTGLICGLAVLARPTNIVIAILSTSYVFLCHKKYFKKFILCASPTLIFLLGYNFLTFGSIFSEGYSARNDISWNTPILLSLSGFLFSPARSFLFISPPLVISYYAMYKALTKHKSKNTDDRFYVYLAFVFLANLLLNSKWWAWHGGTGFGYRMLTDILPIATVFSYLITKNFNKTGKIIVVILMVYSVYIQANAVIFRKARCASTHNWSFYCLQPPKRLPKY